MAGTVVVVMELQGIMLEDLYIHQMNALRE